MADEATDFQPITSQEQLDGILKSRLAREREKVASKYADYDDLKAKAAKFDEAEAAQMSDLEMARKEIGELKAAAAKRDEADRVRDQGCARRRQDGRDYVHWYNNFTQHSTLGYMASGRVQKGRFVPLEIVQLSVAIPIVRAARAVACLRCRASSV